MRTWNFSLASLLAIVTLLCFDLAALVSDSRLATSAAYTAFIALLCFAAAAALAAPATRRAFWIGFAVFGAVYWWAAFDAPQAQSNRNPWMMQWGGIYGFGTSEPPSPTFVTSELLDVVEENIAPNYAVGSHVFARWQGFGYYWGTILQTDGGQYLIKWDDGSPPTWQAARDISGTSANRRVALQAIVATLWSLGGGSLLAFWLSRQKPTESAAESAPKT
jgi:hypothetical protein